MNQTQTAVFCLFCVMFIVGVITVCIQHDTSDKVYNYCDNTDIQDMVLRAMNDGPDTHVFVIGDDGSESEDEIFTTPLTDIYISSS